jgi:hypothetical protein
MKVKLLEPKLYSQAPPVCAKPGCGGTLFLPHEEGWQCFNCMKIMYKANDKVPSSRVYKRYARDNN